MPSLPLTSMTHATLTTAGHASSSDKYREVAYHFNGRDQCMAQSYEIRSPSHGVPALSPQPSRDTQHTLSPRRSSLRQSCARLDSFKPESGRSVLVVQSREYVLQDQAHKATATNSEDFTEPPTTPRPRRLATPDLSDVDEDRPFCHCEFRKDCKSASCQQAFCCYGRMISRA
ncbi:hypothetical protein SVAN01_05214 [Stagonosporopsis vannaccii]|nr:hypothetical protein SVAN01_05214 [Stagonosporopsis vannaccii]